MHHNMDDNNLGGPAVLRHGGDDRRWNLRRWQDHLQTLRDLTNMFMVLVDQVRVLVELGHDHGSMAGQSSSAQHCSGLYSALEVKWGVGHDQEAHHDMTSLVVGAEAVRGMLWR
jgi:hypothetical protein